MKRTLALRFVEYVPKRAVNALPATTILSRGPAASIHEGTALFRETERGAQRSDDEQARRGFFSVPKLNYPVISGVSPVLSAKQFRYVYDVVHRDAVDRLNRMTIGSDVEGHTVETVIRQTSFDALKAHIHTPACEHLNYCFFYNSLRPWGTSMPSAFRDVVALQLGNAEAPAALIEKRFLQAASTLQSRVGWVYLVATSTGVIDVVAFEHGTSPLASDLIPLLGLSVNESTYFMDYSTVGPGGLEAYIANFFKGCNWSLASRYFAETVAGKGGPDPSF
jgi:superoxide dismutase, Fe-Mn family